MMGLNRPLTRLLPWTVATACALALLFSGPADDAFPGAAAPAWTVVERLESPVAAAAFAAAPRTIGGGGFAAQTAGGSLAGASPTRDGSQENRGRLLLTKLILPIFRLSLFIAVGLLLGNLIEAWNWSRYLGRITQPLLRWGRFNDHSAIAFMAAFFSGVTANTLLVNAFGDQRISRRELFYTNILNTLPSFFLHLPTTFFVLLPLVREAGILYLLCTLVAALGRALVVLILGRWNLPVPHPVPPPQPIPSRQTGIRQQIWNKFKRRFRRILVWTVPIYSLFFFLNQFGLFVWIEGSLTRFVAAPFIPVEALSVIAFQVVAEFTAGVAAAGALLDAGGLSIKQTVLALLIGNIVATPVRALRHQLPYYMGIFTPRLGFLLLTVSQVARTSSLILTALLFYCLYPAGG